MKKPISKLKKLKERRENSVNLRKLKKLPKVLNKKEKLFFSLFLLIFIVSGVLLIIEYWKNNTTEAPANGGIFREGVVGQPRFINPVYASSNDVDRDLVNLIYSGLFKYDSSGEIVPDIVKTYNVEDNGKTYNLFLRKNILFQDGEGLDANDVIFTIKTIQNPDFQSPIQAQWLDVSVEKISNYQIKLKLKNPYPAFLKTLTVKILPAHIWSNITAPNFPLSPYNFKPIGSGPFALKDVIQNNSGEIDSISLERFDKYYGQKPHLDQVNFIFLKNQKELIQSAQNNIIDAFSPSLSSESQSLFNFNNYSFIIPRYFALFFNPQKNEVLISKDIRLAMIYATDKEEIKTKILSNKGQIVSSPFLPNIYHLGTSTPSVENLFSLNKAKELLAQQGFKDLDEQGFLFKQTKAQTMNFISTLSLGSKGKTVEYLQQCLAKIDDVYPSKEVSGYFGSKTKEAVIKFQEKYADEILKPSGLDKGNGRVGPSTRKKLNQVCVIAPAKKIPLQITITTTQDDPMLQETANLLKEQWKKVGIKVIIQSLPISEIKQNTIKERNYETFLFGQVLGLVPDPFPFWHSSQRVYPGLNLANYKNEKVDKLLEQARIEESKKNRAEKYLEAQKYLLNDAPALFLYNPDLSYFVSNKIKGVKGQLIPDPSQRFAGIKNWYIKTKRVHK